MKCICAMAVTLAMAASAVPAQEACPVPQGAVKVALPSGLPAALRNALPGDIALPGEPFDTTDVYVKGHKHRCYIFVWNIGSRWIVATEIGGIALRTKVARAGNEKTQTTPAIKKSGERTRMTCVATSRPAGAFGRLRGGLVS